MEQTEETAVDDNLGIEKVEANFVWEEWAVIEDSDNANESSSELNYSDIDNTSNAEEAHESTSLFEEQTPKISPDESGNIVNDESDGVSVISETDNDEPVVDDKGVTVISDVTVVRRSQEANRRNTVKEVAPCVYLFVACSMAIAIGLGLGSRLYIQNKCPRDIDYASIKMENDRLTERIGELNSVKGILEEIKSSIMQERIVDSSVIRKATADDETKKFHAAYLSEHMNRLDSAINEPEIALIERLQIFLRTVCLVLEKIRQNDANISYRSTCDSRSFLPDIAKLRILLNSAIAEMDDSTGTSNRRFLESVDLQLTSMGDSLVFDMTRMLDKLNLKNQRKMEKIANKMRERLCLLRNTMPSDNKIRRSLEMNDSLIEGCDEILAKKFDARKKEKSRREMPEMPQPPISGKKISKIAWPNSRNMVKSKRENSTRMHKRRIIGYRENIWETRKCYGDDPRFSPENSDDTCSTLSAPPRSFAWKSTKRQAFTEELPVNVNNEAKKNDEAIEREKSSGKRSDKTRFKGDALVPKNSKNKMKREESKNRKRSFSSNEKNNAYPRRRKIHSNSLPVIPMTVNSDIDYERAYPSATTSQERVKKIHGKGGTNDFDKSEREENMHDNGQWQFARSRIRDGFRKGGSVDNWYFERASYRKHSRMNVNDDIEKHR